MAAPDFAQEALDSWSTNATHWDEAVGEDGNKYWKILQQPCLARFFADHLKPGCRALDLSTGNGLCARWMASQGAKVLATDGAPGMLQVAQSRTPAETGITFQKLDVTQPSDFAALLESSAASDGFDIVLMNMALMDVATLDPLAEALPKLLKKGGVFVGSMLHPVFFTSRVTRDLEIWDHDEPSRRGIRHTVKFTGYLNVAPWRGWAHRSQPALQVYFHRPLHELLGTFFKSGLAMDGLEEPSFPDEHTNPERMESLANWNEFPPIFAFRMRRVQ